METNINRRVFFQAATREETVGALAINVRREDAKAADQNFASGASGVRLQLSPLWALSPIEQDTACVLTRIGR